MFNEINIDILEEAEQSPCRLSVRRNSDAHSKRPRTQKIKKNKSPINKNKEEEKGMFITLRWYVSKQ